MITTVQRLFFLFSIQRIGVSATTFHTITDMLQNILSYMFSNSEINFLVYRNDLSRSTPEKDLSTFIDQMQRVSVQVLSFESIAMSTKFEFIHDESR